MRVAVYRGPLYIRGVAAGEGGPYIGGPLYIRGVVSGEGGGHI